MEGTDRDRPALEATPRGFEVRPELPRQDPDAEIDLRKPPIRRDDVESLLVEWTRIRDRQLKEWIDRGSTKDSEDLRAEHLAAFAELLDSGDIIRLTVKEHVALTDAFGGVFHAIMLDHYAEVIDNNDDLKSAVHKLCFAFGRCFGLTNFDMQIEEENDAADQAR